MGYREVLGVCEGSREDKESWSSFLRHLKERGLKGVRLVTSDKSMGLLETLPHFFPEALWQRCIVHFYRNVYSAVPKGKAREVSLMLKAIHNQEDLKAARKKADRIRYVASTKWGKRAYMNMEHLREQILEQEEHAVVS